MDQFHTLNFLNISGCLYHTTHLPNKTFRKNKNISYIIVCKNIILHNHLLLLRSICNNKKNKHIEKPRRHLAFASQVNDSIRVFLPLQGTGGSFSSSGGTGLWRQGPAPHSLVISSSIQTVLRLIFLTMI